jgi:peptide deformylase
MVANIVTYGSSILRKLSESVSERDDIVQFTETLFDTLRKANGIGLAGPQIGILKRIFVIDTSLINQKDRSVETLKQVYINPSIIWQSEEEIVYTEGCLSIPEIFEEVERPLKIRVKYNDLLFNSIEEEIDGIKARIFQHEFDHLEGILFIDRTNPLKRRLITSKLKRIVKSSKC